MVPAADPGPPPFLHLAAHPLRWRVLTALADSDRRVRELVELVDQPQNLVSYHLRLLRNGGVVTARRSSHDGRDTYYRLDPDGCADGLAALGAALRPSPPVGPGGAEQPRGSGPRVLFLCTGNSARSPIAEALLRHRSAGRVVTASAGITPKDRIHPQALRVLRERFGIDLSDQAPRSVADVTGPGRRFDHVITLCDRAREHLPAQVAGTRAHWSVPDPAGASAAGSTFASVCTDLDHRVRQLLPALVHAAPGVDA